MYKSEDIDLAEILRRNYVKLGIVLGSVILYDFYWYWQRWVSSYEARNAQSTSKSASRSWPPATARTAWPT